MSAFLGMLFVFSPFFGPQALGFITVEGHASIYSMSRSRHKTLVRTKKFVVEICKQNRQDFIVVRLLSWTGGASVHHHLHPKEAMRFAHGILRAIDFLPR